MYSPFEKKKGGKFCGRTDGAGAVDYGCNGGLRLCVALQRRMDAELGRDGSGYQGVRAVDEEPHQGQHGNARRQGSGSAGNRRVFVREHLKVEWDKSKPFAIQDRPVTTIT